MMKTSTTLSINHDKYRKAQQSSFNKKSHHTTIQHAQVKQCHDVITTKLKNQSSRHHNNSETL